MAEQEDPELTSSHGDIKITTTYGVATEENDLKTSKTFPLQQKYKEGTTKKCRRRHGIEPYSRDGDPQNERIFKLQEFSAKWKESEHHIVILSHYSSTWKMCNQMICL